MKKRSGKDHKKGHLEDDEAELWHRTARSIKPLRKAKGIVLHAEALDVISKQPKAMRETARAVEREHPKAPPVPAAPAKKAPPPIAEFDSRKARKLRSGRLEIEARIDLHGMRQDEAHVALRAFLKRAQDRQLRLVLVITGKGKMGPDDRDEPFDMTRNRSRGVLKLNVPRWLEEPDLRPLVVSYTTAAIAHGGDGALYVHLRKQR